MFRSQILSIRAFRNLWLGQAISIFGDAFYYVVNAFMVKKLTGSSTLVGVNGALECLPYLLASPYAGVIADRLDRRRIMLISDVLSFLTLMMLAAIVLGTQHPPVEAILANGFLLSCCRVFFNPAKNAAIPKLVPADQLLEANALNASTQNIMPMISLGLSAGLLGILYSVSQVWFYLAAILCNAVSFLGSAIFIRKLPSIVPDRSHEEEKHPIQDFKDGLSYMKRRRVLLVMLAQSFVISFALSPFFVAYVAANEAWFGGKPQTLSAFEFSFFGGMVLGSFAVGKMKLRKVGWGSIWGIALCGLSVMVMGFTASISAWLLLNFLAGLALPFSTILTMSYLQATVADEFRGRVQSVSSMISMGAQPIGMGLGGMFLERVGLVASFALMGGGMVLAVFIGIFSKEYRESRLPEPKRAVVEAEMVAVEA